MLKRLDVLPDEAGARGKPRSQMPVGGQREASPGPGCLWVAGGM